MKPVSPIIRMFALLIIALHTSVVLAQTEPRSLGSFSRLNQTQPVPLTLEQAFPYYVSELGPGRLQVNWNIADAHYLYHHAFQFSMKQSSDSESLPVEFTLPDGIQKTDQFFGQIEAYYKLMSVDLNLSTVPGPDAILVIQYQGCAEWGFCYPPQRVEFKLVP